MIKHVIKLIWSRKRKNILLLIEITISFLVLFAIATMVIHNFQKFRLNLGYNYENVWVLRFNWEDEEVESVREKLLLVKKYLESKTEIEAVSATSGNYPYSFATITSEYNDISMHHVSCEEDFFDIMKIDIIKGEGFGEKDAARAKSPVIVNKKAAEALFPGEDPIGKEIESEQIIIGMVDKYRYSSSFMADANVLFARRDLADTSRKHLNNYLIFRVQPGTGRAFEANLMQEINSMTIGWENDLLWLTEEKNRKDKTVWVPIMILIVISTFLIINVALGLFGLLWYNISRRKAEIGLRRAMGANTRVISRQFVLEIIVLTSFSLILGTFFAVQFPILGLFNLESGIYISAMVVSAIFILLLNWLCAIFPSRQASRIQPATALHNE